MSEREPLDVRIVAELDTPYEPPTANDPAELPDQTDAGPRYPLVRRHRDDLGTWALAVLWLRLVWWRWAYRGWVKSRGGP